MTPTLRRYVFDLTQGPVVTQSWCNARALALQVQFTGGGSPPALPAGGYVQFDQNAPVPITDGIDLKLGFLQNLRYVLLVLPETVDPWTASLVITDGAEELDIQVG